MNWRAWLSRPLALVGLCASTIVVLSALVIAASMRGAGPGDFERQESHRLDPEMRIAGWITFDRDSYLPGEIAVCRVHVMWRPDSVTPDLDTLTNSISFYPFDVRDSIATGQDAGDGVREFIADYELQAVNVDATESYLLATAVVYYTSPRAEGGEVHSFRMNPPRLRVGELYPRDISDIPPRGMKPAIRDPVLLRQSLLALSGLALLVMLMLLLWKSGRRRPVTALTDAERLWSEVEESRVDPADERQHMLECERIFLSALQMRGDIDKKTFWSGGGRYGDDLQQLVGEARELFSRIYRPAGIKGKEIEQAGSLLRRLLGPLVDEAEMLRERQPSFVDRIRQQPAILATGITLAVVAGLALALAASPSTWVSSEVLRYNAAVDLVEQDESLEQAFENFSNLTKDASDGTIRAASYYNLGLLVTDPRLSGQPPAQQLELLNAIFQPEVTLDRLLHALEIDADFELLTILSDSARRYVQAETAMKSAVRITPEDADIRRNLEIFGKIRRALADTLDKLINDEEQVAGLGELRRQTIIDLKLLMEQELPEDYARRDEGKDDSNYFIMERF